MVPTETRSSDDSTLVLPLGADAAIASIPGGRLVGQLGGALIYASCRDYAIVGECRGDVWDDPNEEAMMYLLGILIGDFGIEWECYDHTIITWMRRL
jgi:hypothetical protein